LLKSDGKIWVLDNGQDHYTFSETDTDGMVVHRRGGVQYGLGVSSKFVAETHDAKEMRPRWNTMLADGYKRNKMTEQDYGSLMTFDDLVFDDISETTISGNKRAKLFFKNGYGISVLFHPYVSKDYHNQQYEIAVLKGVEEAWDICYDTSVTSDVLRCDKSREVDDLMKKIQELKSDG
jgi:hypothetical protein